MPATKSDAAVSVAIGMILIWPSGKPFAASRTASLASAWTTDAPPSAFGSMMASGRPGATASRSASVKPLPKLFDSNDEVGAGRIGARVFEKRQRGFARTCLVVRRNRVLKVDDQGVGAARHSLGEFFRTVGGHEEQRTHGRFPGGVRGGEIHVARGLSSMGIKGAATPFAKLFPKAGRCHP